jgi:glycosyltransferase involved in cell wall biosynthesis
MERNVRGNGPQASPGRVCIVAPVHAWDNVRVFHKQAITLAAAGHQVVLLAQAQGRLTLQGVQVKAIWAPRTPRLLRFLCLPLVLVQTLLQRADVYHLHNPDTLPLCIALKTIGRRVIYDTHEDFSRRIAIREWIPGPVRSVVSLMVAGSERLVAKIADRTLATQAGVAERLGAKAVLIGNPPRTDAALLQRVYAKAKKLPRFPDDHLCAIYIGLASEGRGLFDMIDAAELVNREYRLRLRIIGPAVPGQIERARQRPGWRYVEYLEAMPQEDAFAYVAASDVGLAVLHDLADVSQADPNKLYEYMAFGKPFIASAFPEWKARLGGTDGGWFVAPGDVEQITAVLKASMDPQARSRKGQAAAAYVRTYNWETESGKLIAVYRGVLAGR